MKERQPNSQEYRGCSGWQNSAAVADVASHSTHRKRNQIISVISEACFTVMTGNRHDKLAAINLGRIAVALTPSWLVWILTVMPVWLYFSSFLFCSVLLLNTKLYILYECYLCLIFIIVRKLAIRVWKPSKLGVSISFSLWGFSSLLKL